MGLEPVGNVMAHHIAVTEKDTDWQIWIKDGPQPVPLRFVVVSKDMPSQPTYTLELKDWETQLAPPPQTFAVRIPAGARRIDTHGPAQQQQPPTQQTE
jgi:hypothetical protein